MGYNQILSFAFDNEHLLIMICIGAMSFSHFGFICPGSLGCADAVGTPVAARAVGSGLLE